MVFKCKICGGSLDVKQGEKITVCEYCGVRQSIPSFIEPKTEEIYNRANNYLMHNEFDKAENLYNQILFDNKQDADAYWNILMCKYGVTYVKDPKTGKYIPTCNRTLYTPIFSDENYQNALKYADEKQQVLYKQNAETVDKIQKGILDVSKHEKPFDIFISYKETNPNGIRTKDSIKAQELYDKLTAEGYKVFFARITLEDKMGTEYEPYIYAALASSKVMITISSSKENIEAVWVKNEWSRFLSFRQKDNSKTLIPLYFDMDKSDLPADFAHLPAYDMTVDGFEQELIRGIKKLIPLPVMLAEKRKKFRKKLKIAGVAVLVLAIVGGLASIPWFMKLPDYNAAMQLYYDKNYPEATWAFADLGNYRNSVIMKDKCEKSWRNSLATVATDNFMSVMRDAGAYFINPNGEVKNFIDHPGNANEGIMIDEHGKVISLGDNNNLYALKEDGYVDNAVTNNQLVTDDEWHNIVQISPRFNVTNVALRSDGKMLYGKTEGEKVEDTWLKDISDWNDVVQFDYCYNRPSICQCIVGVKSDGNVYIVMDEAMAKNMSDEMIETFKTGFKDIKKIDVSQVPNDSGYINAVALTKHNTVITYINGVIDEYSADDVVDVEIYDEFIINDDGYKYNYFINELHSDGKLYKYGNKKYILEDVVYIKDGFAVTRSGTIYKSEKYGSGYDRRISTNSKTKVLPEWTERMK